MSTLTILLLLIICLLLCILRQIRACLWTLLLTVVCFLAVGNGFIPSMLLQGLQAPFVNLPESTWKNKNAIVLLGSGVIKLPHSNMVMPSIMAYSRINETVQRYHECMKSHHQCTIIISGGDALKTGSAEAIVYRDVMQNLGIKSSDMILESKSMNTYQNAEFTSAIIKNGHYDQVILVTSGIHLKRSLLYFSKFGIEAAPALADYLVSQPSVIPLGYNFAMTDFALHEYIGIVRFQLYNFFGWN